MDGDAVCVRGHRGDRLGLSACTGATGSASRGSDADAAVLRQLPLPVRGPEGPSRALVLSDGRVVWAPSSGTR